MGTPTCHTKPTDGVPDSPDWYLPSSKDGWDERDLPPVGEATWEDWEKDKQDREEVRRIVQERNKDLKPGEMRKIITLKEWLRREELTLSLENFVPYERWVKDRRKEKGGSAVKTQTNPPPEQSTGALGDFSPFSSPPPITPEQSSAWFEAVEERIGIMTDGGEASPEVIEAALGLVHHELQVPWPVDGLRGCWELERLKRYG